MRLSFSDSFSFLNTEWLMCKMWQKFLLLLLLLLSFNWQWQMIWQVCNVKYRIQMVFSNTCTALKHHHNLNHLSENICQLKSNELFRIQWPKLWLSTRAFPLQGHGCVGEYFCISSFWLTKNLPEIFIVLIKAIKWDVHVLNSKRMANSGTEHQNCSPWKVIFPSVSWKLN